VALLLVFGVGLLAVVVEKIQCKNNRETTIGLGRTQLDQDKL